MDATLIAGCGFVGSELASRLLADGHEVYGLRRNTSKLPPGTNPVSVDLRSNEAFGGLPNRLDAVVFAAAPDESSDESYKAVYVDGLQRVVSAVASITTPQTRLILVSSTAVYAQSQGEHVDERSPTEPTRFSGRRLLESEAVARGSGMTTTVVRFGGIYGPGRTGLVDRVYSGTAKLSAEPSFTNRIHRDDCAGAIRHLLDLERPPECVIGVDDDPADRNDVISWLAARLGVQAQAASPGVATSRNKRCENALLKSTGYAFTYSSYREGYAAIVDAYLKGN
jgi:nucleoside-diphosphate-sugar epimerase